MPDRDPKRLKYRQEKHHETANTHIGDKVFPRKWIIRIRFAKKRPHTTKPPLVEPEKEKINGCPGPGKFNVFGIANGAIASVLKRAIGFNVTNGGITSVLYRTVRLDVTNRGITSVLHGAIGFDVADRGIAPVLHRAVAFKIADRRITTVLYCAIGFDIPFGAIASVLDGLRIRQRTNKHEEEQDCFFHNLNC